VPANLSLSTRKWAEREIGWVQVHLAWLALISLILLAAAFPARADEFATLVSALGADSFAEKAQAVLRSVSSVTGGPLRFLPR
jgi:hypothetical protein